VKLLAESGADLHATDANGRTALDLARGNSGGRGGGRGGGAPAFPETTALLESLMGARPAGALAPE
jgi:hypothetical protein